MDDALNNHLRAAVRWQYIRRARTMGKFMTVPSDVEIAERADAAVASLEAQCGIAFYNPLYRQLAVVLIQMALIEVRRDAATAAISDTYKAADAILAGAAP